MPAAIAAVHDDHHRAIAAQKILQRLSLGLERKRVQARLDVARRGLQRHDQRCRRLLHGQRQQRPGDQTPVVQHELAARLLDGDVHTAATGQLGIEVLRKQHRLVVDQRHRYRDDVVDALVRQPAREASERLPAF